MNESTDLSVSWAWEPYVPSEKTPWNLQRAGHLYRRAGFGATRKELEIALKEGPARTISLLLEGRSGRDEFHASLKPIADSIIQTNNGQQLAPYWLYRMLLSPHPLEEKMTLFWHNHFATSNAKVQNAGFMLGQNELMRKDSLGNFARMLRSMSTDPAMLVWLDGRDSRKGNPNENYARELMELFSLGIGNYSENDIREAARAFTGWVIRGNKAEFQKEQFDGGVKKVFGKTGNYHPDAIVNLCLEQKACAEFICRKMFRFFVSETIPPTTGLLKPLADQFRDSGYQIAPVLGTILRSNLFFSPKAYRTRIKSPVEFALGIVRGLEGRIGTTALALLLQDMGQNLFYPPSVKGWDGGQAWLNGQTVLYRQNLALALTSTEDDRFGSRTDPASLAERYGAKNPPEILELFLGIFLGDDLPADARERLKKYLDQPVRQSFPVYWTAGDIAQQRIRSLCYLILTQPEYQLS